MRRDDLEIAIVAGTFEARPGSEQALGAVLARYVVLTRDQPSCRNVDLAASATFRGRYLVVEKWESPDAVHAHLGSLVLADLAREAAGLLARPPSLDLYGSISAHDLA